MTGVSNHYTSKGLSPYLTKLGLHTDPFSNEIQDEFFMLDAQRSQHISKYLYELFPRTLLDVFAASCCAWKSAAFRVICALVGSTP